MQASVLNFMIAMMEYPEAQRKAQEEIDSVVGRGRTPLLSDSTRMPYCEGVSALMSADEYFMNPEPG